MQLLQPLSTRTDTSIPYTTLFQSVDCGHRTGLHRADERFCQEVDKIDIFDREPVPGFVLDFIKKHVWHRIVFDGAEMNANTLDQKSTRLNSSHYCAPRMPHSD